MNKNSLILLFMLVISTFLFSEDDYSSLFDDINTETTTDTTTTTQKDTEFSNFSIPDFKLSLIGDHKFEFRMPVIPDYFDFKGQIKAPKFTNEIGIEINYKDLKFKSFGSFDVILNDFGSWDKVLNIKPLENYISWSPWKVKLSAGLQYFSWGTADGLNPTDNINPRDYTVGISSKKIPILSAAFSMYPADFFSFDVIYAPFEQNDVFPTDFVASLPDELFYGKSLDLTSLANYPNLTFSDIKNSKNASYKKLDYDPKSFILGGKTNFRFSKVDFSFSYLYDIDQYYTPEINLTKDAIGNTPNPMPPIPAQYLWRPQSISLVRNRVHKIGADIKATVDRFGLWAEFCYSLTDDYLMDSYKKRNHKISYVAGFDFNYGPNDDFYMNFQYFGEVNLNYYADFYKDYKDGKPDSTKISDEKYMEEFYYKALTDRLGGESEAWLQGISLKMKWPVLDNLLTPSIAASYILPLFYDYEQEKRYGSLYLNPEIDIMPIDSFHIVIGSDLFFSWIQKKDKDVELNKEDKIGIYHKDSSIYLAFKYKWGMDFVK